MRDLTTTPHDMADARKAIIARATEYRELVESFHQLWYTSPYTWGMTYWMGVPLLKSPTDLWTYQEMLFALRPTLLVETGTAFGGSALWFAHCFDAMGGHGRVLSIDVEPHDKLPQHPRVTFLRASSVDPNAVAYVRKRAEGQRVMVVLDSDHSCEHVLAELHAYGPMVSVGQYLVVEDTNINGRPVPIDWKGGPGPGPAVDAWLPDHPEFERDILPERHFLTMHPGGWLKRIA